MKRCATYTAEESRAFYERWGRDFLSYDPETGVFTCTTNPPAEAFSAEWRRRAWITRFSGKPSGRRSHGYFDLSILDRKMYAHRYAIYLQIGRWPDVVDHLNGDGFDNRLCNIREANRSLNMRNRRMCPRNTSGKVGVFFDKGAGRWVASVGVDGREIRQGGFKTFTDAARARDAEAAKHGFGPNHGAISI